MKNKLWIVTLALIAGATGLPMLAADEKPQATEVVKSDVSSELKALVEKIKAKLQAGPATEESLADELKAFDAILAAHKGEKTDDVAQVLLMKASLYLEVLENFEKGEQLLMQLKVDFPGTKQAVQVDRILPMLAKQKEANKLKASFKPGAVFPDFSEKDLSGAPLSISKYKGKVVLVDFWATWCGPCVAELPNVIAAYNKYHDKGFEVIGISLDKDKDKLTSFIKEKNMPWPQYFDGLGWESKLGQAYGIDSIPATFLLDKDGKIIAKGLRGEALSAQLEKLLGK